MDRRTFIQGGLSLAAAGAMPTWALAKKPRYALCLGQYSLHRTLAGEQGPKLDPLDYPVFAKKNFGFEAVDYWSGPFQDKVADSSYLSEMAKRASGDGVRGVLILVDGAGRIGDPDEKKRLWSVEEHGRWLEAAKVLGCSSIRVNAHSEGNPGEQLKLCADGISKLCQKAEVLGLDVLVENHGGLSSNGSWVLSLMKAVGHKSCGTLPDFGNFYEYDRYQGVQDMMPWAKVVCAKSRDFDGSGNETGIDYARMMKIVAAAGYKGYIEIEYEGGKLSELEGVRATKALLEKIIAGLDS